MRFFVFDLDGTITKDETLPIISGNYGIEEKIAQLTAETVAGTVPFVESFIRRVHILGKLPVLEVSALLAGVPLYERIVDFIRLYKDRCVIATGNLDCWVSELAERIPCKCHTSAAMVENDSVVKITTILQKEDVVKEIQRLGHEVVFVGDGNNDMEAMRQADIAIASGLTHEPAASVLAIADYLTYEEESLCRLLNQLC